MAKPVLRERGRLHILTIFPIPRGDSCEGIVPVDGIKIIASSFLTNQLRVDESNEDGSAIDPRHIGLKEVVNSGARDRRTEDGQSLQNLLAFSVQPAERFPHQNFHDVFGQQTFRFSQKVLE